MTENETASRQSDVQLKPGWLERDVARASERAKELRGEAMTPSTDQFEKIVEDLYTGRIAPTREQVLLAVRSAHEAGALSMRERAKKAVRKNRADHLALMESSRYHEGIVVGLDDAVETIGALPLIEPKTGG